MERGSYRRWDRKAGIKDTEDIGCNFLGGDVPDSVAAEAKAPSTGDNFFLFITLALSFSLPLANDK